MQRILKIFKWVDPAARLALLAVTAAEGIMRCAGNPFRAASLLFGIAVLIFLDVGRFIIPAIKGHPTFFSLITISICLLLSLNREFSVIQIYYFFLMGDIFHAQSGKMLKALLTLHYAGFIAVWCLARMLGDRNDAREYAHLFLLMSAIYAVVLFISAVIHHLKQEQERLKVLNADLIEYSFEEREYLVAKERGNISQELHDSIGHSLMAVLMNVRYLKAIQNRGEDERQKQIEEIEILLKECVSNLRESVDSLRKLDEAICLKDEIDRVVQKFSELALITIRLDYDSRAESAPNLIKTVLFKTIREGITNSICHGNAGSILISIRCIGERIEMVMKDNGSGCAEIHQSYGLNGIVERVSEAGGEVSFSSEKNKGFTIRTLLPGGIAN
jgi:signal transduction histidine kinase